ncbi:MAG: hypothetical protein MR387_05970 [Phocaeicola plebeius]|nr:hypothetical protein [Phocaeicola plebeius]
MASGDPIIGVVVMVDEAIVIKEQLLSAGKELVLELKMREYANELGEVVVKRQFQDQDFPRADHRLEDPCCRRSVYSTYVPKYRL